MSGNDRFTFDPHRIVHEHVDGEVILIQLDRGNYYSLAGSGPEIWELLIGGLTEAEIAQALADRHGVGASVAGNAVGELVRELHDEGLIEPQRDRNEGELQTDGEKRSVATNANRTPAGSQFAAPVLEKYTDMQDYLLIDPIHEVADTGWPNVPRA